MSPNTIDTVVHSVTWAGTDLLAYDLRPPRSSGVELPAFDAGAHIDVHIAPGLIRQYSLCNTPAERYRYVVCVHFDAAGRGGSRAMHDGVRPGKNLRISVPRNNFPLAPAQRYVLIAGGVGLTPLLAMAKHLHATGRDFELHVYARDIDHLPLADALISSDIAPSTTIHLGSQGDSLRAGPPVALTESNPATLVYTCGPEGFMQSVTDYALAAGFTNEQIRHERFQPTTTGAGDPSADGSFDVVVASTNQRVAVSPEVSIAEALRAQGIEIELSCEQGMCGACLTPVLAGVPDHRDDVQTPAEHATNSHITVCCSRAKTAELVLDL